MLPARSWIACSSCLGRVAHQDVFAHRVGLVSSRRSCHYCCCSPTTHLRFMRSLAAQSCLPLLTHCLSTVPFSFAKLLGMSELPSSLISLAVKFQHIPQFACCWQLASRSRFSNSSNHVIPKSNVHCWNANIGSEVATAIITLTTTSVII